MRCALTTERFGPPVCVAQNTGRPKQRCTQEGLPGCRYPQQIEILKNTNFVDMVILNVLVIYTSATTIG
jgi:hypothetical protein